jgi:RNA polymerase sigma factor (sigma-70 family)
MPWLKSYVLRNYRQLRFVSWEDVLATASAHLLVRLEKLGVQLCQTAEHCEKRLWTFIRFSVFEAVDDLVSKNKGEVSLSCGDEELSGIPEPEARDDDPPQEIEKDELRLALADCIAELAPEQKNVVTLYRDNWSQAEIARQRDRSRASVTKILDRAIRNLRDCLRGKGLIDD